jgi:hypothetical protein
MTRGGLRGREIAVPTDGRERGSMLTRSRHPPRDRRSHNDSQVSTGKASLGLNWMSNSPILVT